MKRLLLGALLCSTMLLGLIGCGSDKENEGLLDNEVIDKMMNTKKIVIQITTDKGDGEIIKTITAEKEIKEVIDIMSRSSEISGDTTSIGTDLNILMYGENNQTIYTISAWYSGNIGLSDKMYNINSGDIKEFQELLES